MEIFDNPERVAGEWWKSRRKMYNAGLIFSGLIAFVCYAMVGAIFIMPYEEEFEITLFTMLFQGIGYLFFMGVANTLYNLGFWTDKRFNKNNREQFRLRLFKLGFWFSVSFPFLVPLLLVVRYFVEFKK